MFSLCHVLRWLSELILYTCFTGAYQGLEICYVNFLMWFFRTLEARGIRAAALRIAKL